MKYNFDKIIDRKNTLSCKWDQSDNDILPMWVADMDFKTAEPIIDALKKRAEAEFSDIQYIKMMYMTLL